jgi:putative oxidoreductase
MKYLKSYNHHVLLLLVRVMVGIVFVFHGYGKLMDISSTAGFFSQVGIPGGELMAWVVALIELVGGLALIAGVYTSYAAILLTVVMIVAILMVHLGGGFKGMEYQLVLLATSLGFVFGGPGKYSLWGGKCGCPAECDHESKVCQ